MRVPRLHSYYGSLRLPCLILLDSFSSPSCTTWVFAVSLLTGTETPYPQARRIWVRLLQHPAPIDPWWKVTGLPGSWTTPMSTCPALRPRWDKVCPASAARLYCLPQPQRRRLPPLTLFRGSITRPIDSLSTLQPGPLPAKAQDSLPAGCQPLPDGIHIHWVALRNFRSSRSFPNIQAYLAH